MGVVRSSPTLERLRTTPHAVFQDLGALISAGSQAQKGMVAVAEWPSPLAAPPPETPKQRREGVREDGCEAAVPKGHVMTKFAAATVYLQVRRHSARCALKALVEPQRGA